MSAVSVLQARMENRRWIGTNRRNLSEKYADKYIAVFGNEVVASGDSIEEVYEQLNGQPKNAVTFLYLSDASEGWII